MKLDVPFYKQTTMLNCGPTTLKMVLEYLGKIVDLNKLQEEIGVEEGKGVSTIQLAIGAAKEGFDVDLYSAEEEFDESNLGEDFYKNFASEDYMNKLKDWSRTAEELKVKFNVKMFEIDEILSFVSENLVPIVLVDWNVIKGRGEKGYQGHFILVIGFDEENVYIHNSAMDDGEPNMRISKEIFDKARKAKGTEEDVLIVRLS